MSIFETKVRITIEWREEWSHKIIECAHLELKRPVQKIDIVIAGSEKRVRCCSWCFFFFLFICKIMNVPIFSSSLVCGKNCERISKRANELDLCKYTFRFIGIDKEWVQNDGFQSITGHWFFFCMCRKSFVFVAPYKS